MRIAFVTGDFPLVSQTFVINQIADLLEKGVTVEVFAFGRGQTEHISPRFKEHRISTRTHCLDVPNSVLRRLAQAFPKVLWLLGRRPLLLCRCLNFFRYGRQALSLRLLFSIWPLIGIEADVFHCHFGDIGTRFLVIREILRLSQPFVTTLYGVDVSALAQRQSPEYYDRLKKEGALFLVMSRNMKERVVKLGFPEEKIRVHPVSIDVVAYPFRLRCWHAGEVLRLVAVGRLIEKKGFDILIDALAIVKKKLGSPLDCSIIGAGPLAKQLSNQIARLGLEREVSLLGSMDIQQIIRFLLDMHLMIQPSKTARDGDME
jgi:colanic acid/amylovoran biosynthesis glycosyltransferase